MPARVLIAGLASACMLGGVFALPAGASTWNMVTPVTGAQAHDPSESGTDGLREDEPNAAPEGDGHGTGRDGADGESAPPSEDFGCPIRDQDSFEMII